MQPRGKGHSRPSAPCGAAAKAATTTIPIVFFVGGRPGSVRSCTSLSRPGGNITGVTFSLRLAAKRLELLRESCPAAKGLPCCSIPPSLRMRNEVEDTASCAGSAGCSSQVLNAGTEQEFEAAFADLLG